MPVILRWFLRLGPINPITVRLVQNASRRAKHMYIRAVYLAVLILVLLWSLMATTQAGPLSYRELASAGASSFTWIAYLQIGLICILAPVFMAGAIAQESSPRTWEILLTTPLSPMQIVLGNLLGRLTFIMALLLASMPLFALTQYFGGVPGSSIFASYLIAGCAALLVGTIAITLSVSRLVGRRAVFAFYVSVVSYIAATAAVDAWLQASRGSAGVTPMTALNPFLALTALLNPTTYPRAPEGSTTGVMSWLMEHPVATWCWGSLAISTVLVLASALTVRTGGLQGIAGGSGVPWYRRLFGLGAKGAEHRPPRAVWHNPIAWREAAARNSTLGKIVARWSFIVIGALWGVALVVIYHGGGMTPSEFRLALGATVWAELAVTALVAINMAATAVSREREDGTLDLLLTTALSPGAYLSGKLRGLVAYLTPMMAVPVATLLIAGLYVLTGGMGGAGAVSVSSTAAGLPAAVSAPLVLPEAGLLAAVLVAPFMAFCVMVGLQWSLKSKGTLGSVVGTVGVVGVVAGVVGLCGWGAGSDIAVLGPVLAGLSPASLVYALIHPVEGMRETISNGGADLTSPRIALMIGSVVGGLSYVGIVYGIHANMVRTFDFTVRRLAGTR